MDLVSAVTVNRPPDEVYRQWRDFSALPRFMYHLESVDVTGETTSHWRAKAPLGRTVEWDAEIVQDSPGQEISWRSTEGADVENVGLVRFTPAPGNQGTEVRVAIRYSLPGGKVGQVLARLTGEEPQQQVDDDLRRFKQLVETGEVVRSDGSPEGHAARQQATQSSAQPSDG